ncbi:site-specific integrase [Lewinella sp. 4G2]|uniref:site-specific integrase n=1 Tax=Lewinella sp. 4G2 TaxID=1803372 RepID=UPI0007B4D41E|nr:site-specific integrase [Lewinella sp. 4G2]OAV44717.1 hypothetical protein A3850_009535 [Lewinella sp. 4G2]
MPYYRHTARVRFQLKEAKAKSATPIVLVTYVNRRRVKWQTGERIHPADWNTTTRRPIIGSRSKGTAYQLQLLKERLDGFERQYLELYREWQLDTAAGLENYNPDKLRLELSYRVGHLARPGAAADQLDASGFVRFAESVRDHRKQSTSIKRGTWKVLNNHVNLLREYADLRHGGAVAFDEVDELFIDGLKRWLYRSKDHSRRTVHKVMITLRSIATRADDRGLMTYGNRFKRWTKVSFRKLPQPSLNRAEFDALRLYDFTDEPRLDRVRDLFLIGIATAQRWSDYSKLTPANFTALPGGGYRYFIQSQRKTGKPAAGAVMSWAVPVLEKYGYVGGGEFNPPTISPAKFNDYLKEVGQMAIPEATFTVYRDGEHQDDAGEVVPLWQMMSSHAARRTAVGMLRTLRMPDNEIQKMTGHKTLTELDGYDVRGAEELALEQRRALDAAFAKAEMRIA